MTTVSYIVVVLVTMIITMLSSLGTFIVWVLFSQDKLKANTDNAGTSQVRVTPPMWTNYSMSSMTYKIEKLIDQLDECTERINKLEKDMEEFHQFYYIDSENDESLVDMYKELKNDISDMKTDYEKRFQALSELSKEYAESFQSIDDAFDRIELEKMNDEEKAKWIEERGIHE